LNVQRLSDLLLLNMKRFVVRFGDKDDMEPLPDWRAFADYHGLHLVCCLHQ
jgi:hypothetical protein